MTCIIGILDQQNDCVYMGADSLISTNHYKLQAKNKKIFKAKDNANVLMASCGSIGMMNFLSESEGFIDELVELKNEVNLGHIVTHTVPKIITLAQKFNFTINIDGRHKLSGDIIFAYKNQLYIIYSDGGVIEPLANYVASGSGIEFALGALGANGNKTPVERIKEALIAAEKHGMGIQRPFYILNTKNANTLVVD